MQGRRVSREDKERGPHEKPKCVLQRRDMSSIDGVH